MTTAFSRTLRSLGADGFRLPAAGIVAGAALLGIWAGWATLASVSLYEVSDQARIEVGRAVYSIQSPIVGRVVHSELVVGRQVKAGEVLIELEAQSEKLQIGEQTEKLTALEPELAALRAQAAAERQALEEERAAARTSIEEARANARQAQAPAKYAEEEALRLAKLREGGLIAERDFQKGRSEADRYRAAVDGSEIAIKRIEQEQRAKESDRESRLRRLDAEMVRILGQIGTIRSLLPRLEYEVDRRRVRAPVSGRLGEVALLRVGAIVQEGDKLGAIVPEGRLTVVAQFAPPAAMGRVRPGQSARMRLQGFPWTQYGTVQATVSSVASEVRDGLVRVELAVDVNQPTAIPMQHGLPGNVEIEVERVAPATLVLRTAGRLLSEPRSAFVETAQVRIPEGSR